jgi:hypothetical protein
MFCGAYVRIVMDYPNLPYEREEGGGGCSGSGEGEVFFGKSGWSIAVRGEGVVHESWINKRFLWVIFHPVEAQEAQEIHICPKVRGLQNSNFNSVGWNNSCHRAQLHFYKLVRHMRFIGFTVQARTARIGLQCMTAKTGLPGHDHQIFFRVSFFFALSYSFFWLGARDRKKDTHLCVLNTMLLYRTECLQLILCTLTFNKTVCLK